MITNLERIQELLNHLEIVMLAEDIPNFMVYSPSYLEGSVLIALREDRLIVIPREGNLKESEAPFRCFHCMSRRNIAELELESVSSQLRDLSGKEAHEVIQLVIREQLLKQEVDSG